MELAKKLASTDPRIIKAALFELLDAETTDAVLALDNAFKTARDKQAFIAAFETTDSTTPANNPALLERWTHYRWLRLELSYLANHKAALNQISHTQPAESKQADELSIPAVTDSINLAIQQDAQNTVPITRSIETLRQMHLQIVGTEHPTDPLSQPARDHLTHIAIAMEASEPNETVIRKLLHSLQATDAIPPSRRAVEEEVNRDINMTLDKLYDAVPTFVKSILTAYQTYYGETAYLAHKADILQALQGGLQPTGAITSPILRDASWAGFDADGNDYVTPESMRYALRLHRIRAAEKHSATLETHAIETSKEIEKALRSDIIKINLRVFEKLFAVTQDAASILGLYSFQNQASQLLVDRKFAAVISLYEQQRDFLQSLNLKAADKAALSTVFDEQYKKAIRLNQLTRFSGTYRINEQLQQGDLQAFQDTFKNYKNAIREKSDAITIKDKAGNTHLPTAFALMQYRQIMQDHAELFISHPELGQQMHIFGIQLSCFGMTHGAAHVRQDSSVYIQVWNLIFNDLRTRDDFQHSSLANRLRLSNYIDLPKEERSALHKQLRDGSDASQRILTLIRQNYLDLKYKKNPGFSLVQRELERLELALQHQDMIENIIISNSESAANILEVETLLAVFPEKNTAITVVPLLEKRQDLEDYEAILTDLIKSKIQHQLTDAFDTQNNAIIQLLRDALGVVNKEDVIALVENNHRSQFKRLLNEQPRLRDYLKGTIIEVMVGFSDTERVSGLPALISVQQVQEDVIHLAQDFGLSPKLYHGPGGDANRGGLRRRDEKATLQGNARSNMLSTPQSTARFRETQFFNAYHYHADPLRRLEFTGKPAHIQTMIEVCKTHGARFYEYLHDTKNGLGKLLGLMLGQGVHWMVNILNSSSRATQRGIAEHHGDRTASVQTGGIRPEAVLDPDKPRAITAAQIKEMLRDNMHLLMGAGYGLRQLGRERAERLFDTSETIRDMVIKTMDGLARTDFSFAAIAFFTDHAELLPKDRKERQQWASECETQYTSLLKDMDIDKTLHSPAGRQQLLHMLSRLFAFIQEESEATREFLLAMSRSIHQQETSATNDILSPYPALAEQEADLIAEVEPLCLILARQNHHVARGRNLDQVYAGLNDEKPTNSKLSGVGRLLGNVGAGITAFRIMPPALSERASLDFSEDLRQGVTRAESEASALGREIQYGKTGKKPFPFFAPAVRLQLEAQVGKMASESKYALSENKNNNYEKVGGRWQLR